MKNWIKLHLQEVLDKDRLNLLEKIKEIKKLGFYLAWWTGLGLLLWHRKSKDFDFFIKWWLNENDLFENLLKIFNQENVKKIFSEKNTLYIEINWVKFSFFWYDYDLIWELIKTDYFDIASIKDIWAMKLWAIQKRATNKDYVDLYYILQKISLKDLIDTFLQKYWNVISWTILLKSLVYFDDIKEEKLILTDKTLTFDQIKDYLVKIVREFEKI